jgi:hypothetical protein
MNGHLFVISRNRVLFIVSAGWLTFVTREEWELAEWLIRSLGQTRTDEFLKLPIVSSLGITEKCAYRSDRLETEHSHPFTITDPSCKKLMSFLMDLRGVARRSAFRETKPMRMAGYCTRMSSFGHGTL